MALSELSKSIRRFAALHAKQKIIAQELDSLKAYFREQSAGQDVIFQYRDCEVLVTNKTRTGWDSDLLTKKLGDQAAAFKKASSYQEVTCRRTAEEG